MHSQARKVATLSPPHTPRSLYLCAIFSIYSVVSSVPHTPRYIYAWLFFSVCSVNPFVPHTHTTYICGHSSQSVALFPPIPHSICVSLLSHLPLTLPTSACSSMCFCMFISILLRIHQYAEYIELHLNTACTPLKPLC